MRKNKGITLVALIITTIIMLILAGVTIGIVLNGGIIDYTKEAKTKQEEAADVETIQFVALGYLTETGKIDFEAFKNEYTEKAVAGFEINYIDDNIYATAEKDGIVIYYIDEKGNVTKTVPLEVGPIVTFNTNGGSTVACQTVTSGGTATLPTPPTKSDYKFGGWYEESTFTTPFDFATSITADTTIYAKWIFNMIGTWNINIPSDGLTYTGIVNVIEQTETSFTGTIKIGEETTDLITDGQLSENIITFTRNYQQNYYQYYSGTLDVSSGTCIITGSFTGSGGMTFKMTKST